MEMTDHQLLASLKKVQENIQNTMAELTSLKEEILVNSQKEERSNVFKFIEEVKKAGFTADLSTMQEFVDKKFSLPQGKATLYLIDYIEMTKSTSMVTIPVAQPVAQPVTQPVSQPVLEVKPVKRKGPKPYSEMTPEELAIAKASKAAKTKVEALPEAEHKALPEDEHKALPEAEHKATTETIITPVLKKRVLGVKKMTDASRIWYSFIKMVQAEMEATGEKPKYEDVLKKAKEMKDGDKDAYQLFSSTWTPEDQVPSN